MNIALMLAVGMLAVGAIFSLIRLQKGPGILDRALAVDVLSSILVGALAIYAAWTKQTETIPILVALSLVGFVGSVTIARFAANEARVNKRIKTPEEIAAEEAERLARLEREMRPDFELPPSRFGQRRTWGGNVSGGRGTNGSAQWEESADE